MSMSKKARRVWLRSFFRIIAFRYLLTPFGTITRMYWPDGSTEMTYRDYYIFGIRIARIHRA